MSKNSLLILIVFLCASMCRAQAQNTAAPEFKSSAQSTALSGGTVSTFLPGNIERESGPINILFVLDCSYSMKEKFGGDEKKMIAAKQVLESALTRIPNDVNLGLRVFGQGFSNMPDADCRATQLVVPLGTHNRNAIIQRVRQIEPFGMTPLEFALRRAAEDDFRGMTGPKTIILISDGADTCGGDPCAFISMLPRYGIRIKVDVVGLDLKRDPRARYQLNCVAETSGGHYYDANSAGDLIDSVSHSIDKAISGRVLPKKTPDQAQP